VPVLRDITGWCVDQLQSTRAEVIRVDSQTTLTRRLEAGMVVDIGESPPEEEENYEKVWTLRA
jgi:hypothetical protein